MHQFFYQSTCVDHVTSVHTIDLLALEYSQIVGVRVYPNLLKFLMEPLMQQLLFLYTALKLQELLIGSLSIPCRLFPRFQFLFIPVLYILVLDRPHLLLTCRLLGFPISKYLTAHLASLLRCFFHLQFPPLSLPYLILGRLGDLSRISFVGRTTKKVIPGGSLPQSRWLCLSLICTRAPGTGPTLSRLPCFDFRLHSVVNTRILA